MAQKEDSFGWGLIGLGRHADRFIVPAILKSSRGRLAAVYSRDIERAKAFALRHGSPKSYDDLEALFGDKSIHGVYVCSPNEAHREQVIRAAQAGKHVLCEKPLANSVEDCNAMIEACRQAGVKLGVGFNLRHNPANMQAKEIISSGEIGDLLFTEIQYMHVTKGEGEKQSRPAWRSDPALSGGGSFVGTGVHAVDLLRFVLGKEITQVFAQADSEFFVSGCERIIQVSLLMEGHHVGSLSAGNMKYPTNQLVLYGTSATLRCSGSLGNYGGGRLELISDQGVLVRSVESCDVYLRELDAFVESTASAAEPNASGLDGLKCAEVTAAVYRSARTKSLVELGS